MTKMTMTAAVAKRPTADDDDDDDDDYDDDDYDEVAAECPAHILSFLKHHLGGECPIHIHAEKSAQQSVLILRYAQQQLPPSSDVTQTTTANNDDDDEKQLALTYLPSHPPATDGGSFKNENNALLLFWRDRLIQGNYRLVVRIWKGGSKWWNLHRNDNKTTTTSAIGQHNGYCNQQVNGNHHQQHHHHHHYPTAVHELATSEIAGYKIARLLVVAANLMNQYPPAHDDQHVSSSSKGNVAASNSSSLVIPVVLHADMDDVDPWAILEYVGRDNPRFFSSSSSSKNSSDNNSSNNNDNDNDNIYDDYWTRHMILVRDEFGFSEPHPRWGRVPVDQCLAYATTVLVQVIIPLHESFQRLRTEATSCSSGSSNNQNNGIQKRNEFQEALQNLSGWKSDNESGYTYETMIELYKSAWKEMSSSMDSNIDPTNNDNNDNNIEDRRLRQAIQLVGQCIDHLQKESETILRPLPPVLVHMDCQPQNLLFARRHGGGSAGQQQSLSLHVSSLLDWEEAAYADPRFELLLLGRKVCANKEQAEQIWDLYEAHQRSNNIQLGPIDPWLCLETVHSLTTLLLQAMDLAGGGRSPWESKPELWGKIEREFGRLVARGWTFCQEYAAVAATT